MLTEEPTQLMSKFRPRLSSRTGTGEKLFQRLRKRYREPMVNTPFRLTKTGIRSRK